MAVSDIVDLCVSMCEYAVPVTFGFWVATFTIRFMTKAATGQLFFNSKRSDF